ncbi:uncharacterized protein LOC143041595 [Oratosquilla oratoria]|uniref:uncharacterized protein LOC143041595 n=1 Tax=Oratosquilla oratoria TaxID=337810 RepID=UPI003F76D9AC
MKPSKGPREPGEFAYADNVGIVEATSKLFALTVDLWNRILQDHGLIFNLQKTEVMVVSWQNKLLQVEVDGNTLQETTGYKYLGVMYNDRGTHEGAIHDRIQKHTANINFLYPLLKKKNVPMKIKTTVYKTILRPTLMYSCGAWTLTNMTIS